MRCKTKVHHKDSCSTFLDYPASGAPNPLNSQGIPWCQICQTRDHRQKECLYLQKILSRPTSIYCKFHRSMGHDEKDRRAY